MLQRRDGFSLLELVIALVIVAFIIMAGMRTMDNVMYSKRFYETAHKLEELGSAMVGYPSQGTGGNYPASFGYIDDAGDLDSLDDLDKLRPYIDRPFIRFTDGGTTREDYEIDAWGVPYYIENNATFVLRSAEAGTDFARDIQYKVAEPQYAQNRVRIFVRDAQGTVLRAHDSANSDDVYFHVAALSMEQAVGGVTLDLASGTLVYTDGCFESNGAIAPAGYYTVTVTMTEGNTPPDATDGTYDLRYLSGYDGSNTETSTSLCVYVAPHGSAVWQHIELRVPGVLDPDQVHAYISGAGVIDEPVDVDNP